MRAIVDSNVFVSYLLNKSSSGAVGDVLRFAVQERIRIAIPPEQIEELQRVIMTKPFLREKISLMELERFITLLETIGDILPPIKGDPPHVVRDRHDDFLIESAKQNKIDLIVSGDRDLLEWRDESNEVLVVPPANLENWLDSQGHRYP